MIWQTDIIIKEENSYYLTVCEMESDDFDFDGQKWRMALEAIREQFPLCTTVTARIIAYDDICIGEFKTRQYHSKTARIPFNVRTGISNLHEEVTYRIESQKKLTEEEMLDKIKEMDASGVPWNEWTEEEQLKYIKLARSINKIRKLRKMK